MLSESRVEANIPAADIDRAKAFYADKLGLKPSARAVPGLRAVRDDSGTAFNIYQTQYADRPGTRSPRSTCRTWRRRSGT